MEWVLRAGEAKPKSLMDRYTEHLGMRGVYGFSVLYQPGLSWQALLQPDGFPNPTVSVAHDDELAAALAPLGYTMRLIKTPGRRYHHTFCVLYDATGTMLREQCFTIYHEMPPRLSTARLRVFPIPTGRLVHRDTQERNP